ncbi:MAG: carboxypeptidase regulatory-like domain-containing protein [Bacteroidota bacterium]
MKKTFLLALVALIAATTLFNNSSLIKAEDGPRSFYGTVTYSSNLLTNASVTITNTQTQQQYQLYTDENGVYTFGTFVAAGTYNLHAYKNASGGGYYIGTVYNQVYCPNGNCTQVHVDIHMNYVEDPQ